MGSACILLLLLLPVEDHCAWELALMGFELSIWTYLQEGIEQQGILGTEQK